MSKDDKLLSTFKKINEINANKMAERPEFVIPTDATMVQLKKMKQTNGSVNSMSNQIQEDIINHHEYMDFNKFPSTLQNPNVGFFYRICRNFQESILFVYKIYSIFMESSRFL